MIPEFPQQKKIKKYVALITQTGTNAPTVEQIFQNDFNEEIIWTRVGVGQYRGTLTGAFPENKTRIPPFDVPYGYISIPLSNDDPMDGFYVARRADDDFFSLEFNDLTYNSIEWSDAANGMKLFFEINVYQ